MIATTTLIWIGILFLISGAILLMMTGPDMEHHLINRVYRFWITYRERTYIYDPTAGAYRARSRGYKGQRRAS